METTSERRGSDRIGAEPADQRQVSRHHHDLRELRQRKRDRELQRFRELGSDQAARSVCPVRACGPTVDAIKRCHDENLSGALMPEFVSTCEVGALR